MHRKFTISAEALLKESQSTMAMLPTLNGILCVRAPKVVDVDADCYPGKCIRTSSRAFQREASLASFWRRPHERHLPGQRILLLIV